MSDLTQSPLSNPGRQKSRISAHAKNMSRVGVQKNIFRAINIFARADVFGYPALFDFLDRISKKAISLSAQIGATIFFVQKINLTKLLKGILPFGGEWRSLDNLPDYAALLMICGFVVGIGARVIMRLLDRLSGGAWVSFSRQIKHDEIQIVYGVYTNLFLGHQLMPLQIFRYLVERRLLNCYVVFKEHVTGDREKRLCGFFVMHFMSETGLQRLLSGKTDGRHFDSEDLVADQTEAKAIYFGALGGRTHHDRACVMNELLRLSRDIPDVRLLARPATPDGVRIAKKFGWTPLKADWHETTLEVWEGKKPLDL